MKKRLRTLLHPTVIPFFWFCRWVRHNVFLRDFNSPVLPSPSLPSRPFLAVEYYGRRIARLWKMEFIDYALSRYTVFIPRHYAKGGWGYLAVESMSEQQCRDRYDGLHGRVAYYIGRYKGALTYRDGESFLDVGCGLGQNIKELLSLFPSSELKGFDVNDATLRVIRIGSNNAGKLKLEVGSALDLAYLKSYADGSFDHVIMSHVMPHLLSENLERTRQVRQAVIDELLRIAAKSVLIMDTIRHSSDDEEVTIQLEQNNRCALVEPPARYFKKHRAAGELIMMFGPENEALFFRK